MIPVNQLGRYFGIIQRETQNHLNRELHLPGITATNANFLSFIRDYQQVTAKQLAATLSINKGLVSRELDKLEAGGYILRRLEASDRRSRVISLTPAGSAAVEQVQTIMKTWWQQILPASQLPAEPAELLQQLRQLAETMSGQSQAL